MAEAGSKIDVVSDFSYASRNEKYNRAYLQWRKTNRGKYMYTYSGNPNEIVYVEGKTVTKPSAAASERSALTRCSEIIGMALLVYLVTEIAGGTILLAILRLANIDVRLDFLSFSMGGSQWGVALTRAIAVLLKYSIPTIALRKYCKLSSPVAFPLAIGGMPDNIAVFGLAMITAAIYSITANSAGVEMAQQIFQYKDSAAVISYGVFEVLIGSLFAEMFLRGAVLPLLRQFGDWFAIWMTALAALLFPGRMYDRLSGFLLGLAAGYLLVQTGSITKCVLLRSLYTTLIYARLIPLYTNQSMPLWQFALMLFSIGTISVAVYVRIRRDSLRLRNRKTMLSSRQKFLTAMQTVTTMPWFAVSLLIALFQMFY